MAQRYFVKILAQDRRSLHNLQDFGLDLFRSTARAREQSLYSIEGMMTLDEVAMLVRSGYRVLVEDLAENRARAATEIISFPQWLEFMEEK
jgi:hypothetical protein